MLIAKIYTGITLFLQTLHIGVGIAEKKDGGPILFGLLYIGLGVWAFWSLCG